MKSPKVTAEERANLVIMQKNPVWYSKGDDSVNDWATLAKEVAEQITLAAQEAYDRGCREMSSHNQECCDLAYASGAEAMREKAAKVADSFNPKETRFESEIGKAIRALPLTQIERG